MQPLTLEQAQTFGIKLEYEFCRPSLKDSAPYPVPRFVIYACHFAAAWNVSDSPPLYVIYDEGSGKGWLGGGQRIDEYIGIASTIITFEQLDRKGIPVLPDGK